MAQFIKKGNRLINLDAVSELYIDRGNYSIVISGATIQPYPFVSFKSLTEVRAVFDKIVNHIAAGEQNVPVIDVDVIMKRTLEATGGISR